MGGINISLADKVRIAEYQDALAVIYNGCFNVPPYFERFSQNEVVKIFEEYAEQGFVFFATDGNRLAGFGAAVPSSAVKDLTELLSDFRANAGEYWYHADVGVDPGVQGRGIGKLIIEKILLNIPSDRVFMRTHENNGRSVYLHKKFGFKAIEGMIQEKENIHCPGGIDKRIFMEKIKDKEQIGKKVLKI